MFEWVGDLVKRFGEALIPIRKMDAKPIYSAVRHPLRYKKLIDMKQKALIRIDRTGDIDIVGGIQFSNVVLNPELMEGYVISERGSHTLQKKNGAYIVHPDIPFVLVVDDKAKHAQINISAEERQRLGLPEDWVQLQSEALANLCISKWMAGFDEHRGSVMIFLFGLFSGIFIGVVLVFFMFILINAFSKR